MADIDIQCPFCKTVTSISEFADITSVTCKSCGRSIERPRMAMDGAAAGKLSLRTRPDNVGGTPASANGYLNTIQPPKRRRHAVTPWRFSQRLTAWLMFLALGAGMAFLRYGHSLPAPYLNVLTHYGPLAILVFQILILLIAFQDSIYQGILCLLIPGYSFIYLFFISDDYYVRALFAGLLVGIAEDSFFFYQEHALAIFQTITAWLARGA